MRYALTEKLKIEGLPVSLGQAVLGTVRSSLGKPKLIVLPTPPAPIHIPAPIKQQEITKAVWLRGNLISQDGKYFPQLTLHTDANVTLLDLAAKQLREAGFDEKKWTIVYEEARVCLRRNQAYTNPQDGYIALSGMVWDACSRTGLQYANLAA